MARTQALSVQTRNDRVGRERETGSRGNEVSINVSQRRLCLDCKLLLADALLFYNQRSLSRERQEGRKKKARVAREGGKGGRKRNSGRAPKGKKGLVNTIIIFKNITGAAAA